MHPVPRLGGDDERVELAAGAWGLLAADVDSWRARIGCRSAAWAARDLVLTQIAIVVASHPVCESELALRGGLALHRLTLPRPLRCCASLEYARCSASPIGAVLDALRDVADEMGLRIRTEVRDRPRVYLSPTGGAVAPGPRLRIDVETRETQSSLPRVRRPLDVSTSAFTRGAHVLTHQPEELLGLALRELYRRSRGRDLFDLWAGLTGLDADETLAIAAFRHAMSLSGGPPLDRGAFAARLHRHLARPAFARDLDGAIGSAAADYDPVAAARLVTARLLDRLPNGGGTGSG